MPEIEEEVIGSHTDDDQQDAELDAILKEFDIDPPVKEDKQDTGKKEDAPAKEQPSKKMTVKYNKEDVEIDEDKIPEYVQKGLALDKERERKSELEKTLDRAAKLAGFKDHAEYVANLDKLEQAQQQKEQDEYRELRESLRQEFIEAGLDPDKADAYLDNHPLIKQAQTELSKAEERRLAEQQEQAKQQYVTKWNELYQAFPDLMESAKAFNEGKEPDWYTPDMKSRIEKGYDPIDAYKLSHADKLQTQTKKITEQRLIKEQQLGLRSRVETTPEPDNEPVVPDALASAFAAFDLPVSAAKKYVKK